jgi:hypothetical protein
VITTIYLQQLISILSYFITPYVRLVKTEDDGLTSKLGRLGESASGVQ